MTTNVYFSGQIKGLKEEREELQRELDKRIQKYTVEKLQSKQPCTLQSVVQALEFHFVVLKSLINVLPVWPMCENFVVRSILLSFFCSTFIHPFFLGDLNLVPYIMYNVWW